MLRSEKTTPHLFVIEHAHQMAVHLPGIQRLLIVHLALCEEDVDGLEVIDVLVLLESLANLCSDGSCWEVCSVECYNLWSRSVGIRASRWNAAKVIRWKARSARVREGYHSLRMT